MLMLAGTNAPPAPPEFHHGGCMVDAIGAEGILQMEPEQQAKLTIADTGVELMRRLILA